MLQKQPVHRTIFRSDLRFSFSDRLQLIKNKINTRTTHQTHQCELDVKFDANRRRIADDIVWQCTNRYVNRNLHFSKNRFQFPISLITEPQSQRFYSLHCKMWGLICSPSVRCRAYLFQMLEVCKLWFWYFQVLVTFVFQQIGP